MVTLAGARAAAGPWWELGFDPRARSLRAWRREIAVGGEQAAELGTSPWPHPAAIVIHAMAMTSMISALPFGGRGDSGFGRKHGEEARTGVRRRRSPASTGPQTL